MDPAQDPTPFIIHFKDARKNLFSYNFPTGTSFLQKFCVKLYFLRTLFQSAQHIYEKREGSGAGSESAPLTSVVDPDPDPVGSGTFCRIRIRSRIRNKSFRIRIRPIRIRNEFDI
jgi:hypothetical protein